MTKIPFHMKISHFAYFYIATSIIHIFISDGRKKQTNKKTSWSRKKIECFFSSMITKQKQESSIIFAWCHVVAKKDATKLLHLCHHIKCTPSWMNSTKQTRVSCKQCVNMNTHHSLISLLLLEKLLTPISLCPLLSSYFGPLGLLLVLTPNTHLWRWMAG